MRWISSDLPRFEPLPGWTAGQRNDFQEATLAAYWRQDTNRFDEASLDRALGTAVNDAVNRIMGTSRSSTPTPPPSGTVVSEEGQVILSNRSVWSDGFTPSGGNSGTNGSFNYDPNGRSGGGSSSGGGSGFFGDHRSIFEKEFEASYAAGIALAMESEKTGTEYGSWVYQVFDWRGRKLGYRFSKPQALIADPGVGFRMQLVPAFNPNRPRHEMPVSVIHSHNIGLDAYNAFWGVDATYDQYREASSKFSAGDIRQLKAVIGAGAPKNFASYIISEDMGFHFMNSNTEGYKRGKDFRGVRYSTDKDSDLIKEYVKNCK
jgi:hypothetical protein